MSSFLLFFLQTILLRTVFTQVVGPGQINPINLGPNNGLGNIGFNNGIGFGSPALGQTMNGMGYPNAMSSMGTNPGMMTPNLPASGISGMSNMMTQGFAANGMSGIPPINGLYGGIGNGDLKVAGELPVAGTTVVAGQVPIVGAVQFGGDVRAGGVVTISGSCGCNTF